MKSKTYTQSKRPLDKNQSSKFCQSGVKQTHFQNLKEKGKWFFLSQGHFKQRRPLRQRQRHKARILLVKKGKITRAARANYNGLFLFCAYFKTFPTHTVTGELARIMQPEQDGTYSAYRLTGHETLPTSKARTVTSRFILNLITTISTIFCPRFTTGF